MCIDIHRTITIEELPPELLVHIFHLVRDASLRDSPKGWSSRALNLNWIKVSFVSRRWRELAITTSSLWAHIDMTMPHVAAEMLRRSQTAPLHLHTGHGPPSSSFEACKPAWLIARRNISRVRELNLPRVDSRELELLTQDIDSPTLLLESIRIYPTHFFQPSPRFFECKMPSLRVLNISNVAVPRPLPAFPQLVTLELDSYGGGLLTALEVLASLELMPMLEYVGLRRILLPMASSALAKHKPVNLPKLKDFTIASATLDAVCIVNAIRYPMEAAIRITCDESHFMQATIEATVNICSRLRKHPYPISCAYICYDDDGDCMIELEIETVYDTVPLSLGLRKVTTLDSPCIVLRRLCAALPWESIESVTVNLFGWPESWAETLVLWSAVKAVDVRALSPSLQPKFCEGLRDLPKLETLTLCWESDVKTCIPSLIDMLSHRQACGLPGPQLLYEYQEVTVEDLVTGRYLEY